MLASLAVAGAVVVLVALLPTTSIARILFIGIGHLTLTLVSALLFCGLFAISASIRTAYRLSREVELSGADLFKSNLGFLIIALVLFGLIYVAMTTWYLYGGT